MAYVAASDNEVLVGLKAPGTRRGVERGVPVIDAAQRDAGKAAVVAVSGASYVSEDDRLPLVRLRLADQQSLTRLRRLPVVDYIEPARILPPEGAESIAAEGLLCGNKPYDQPFTPYRTAQGDLISNVYGPDIARAWARSAGEGVTIGVVGTGVSVHQPQLMNDFTNGQSGGRTLIKDATDPRGFPVPWHDDCGHETKLIGYIGAPLDGYGVAGVAYRSSIYSVRVDDDTNLGNDSDDVREGIRRAAQNYDIVAMAFGTSQTRESIKAEIEYWHDNPPSDPGRHPDGEPPLFVGAAGTGYVRKYVLFPGKMPEVLTVTGNEVNGDVCESCHRGEEIEFALFAHEPVLHPDGGYGYIQGGGSSQGVATFSAMAALVWSRYPTFSADQVVTRLREAAPRYFLGQGKDARTGWGAPRIDCAVGGLCAIRMTGGPVGDVEDDGSYTFSVSQLVNSAPARIHWEVIGSGASIVGPTDQPTATVAFYQGSDTYYPRVAVTLTDDVSGATESASRRFIVRDYGDACDPNGGPGSSC